MAKRKVEWLFALLDKVSGPVDKIGSAVDALAGKFDKLDKVRQKLEKPFKMGGPAGGGSTESKLADKLGGLGTTIGVAVAGMAALSVAGVGFAISTASAKTNLGIALQSILGSKDAAKAVAAQIEDLAAKTPFEGKDVANSVKTLLAAGYQAQDAFRVFTALGDATAMSGFDPQQLEGMTRAMAKLRGDGKLTGDVLQQVSDNSGGLVGKGRILDELAILTKKSRTEVQKQLSAGKIDADVGTKAIVEAIRKNLSGGELGGAMAKMGQEIPGLLSTLKDNLTSGLIPSVDDNAGFAAVRKMFQSLVAASDRAKPFLQQSFGRLFSAVLGGADFSNSQGVFEALFAGIGRGVQVVAGVIETVTPYARAFAYGFLVGLQRVRDALQPVGAALSKVFGGASGGEMLINVFVRLGQGLAIVLAIGAAVVSFLAGVIGFVSAVGVAVIGFLTGVVGVYSDLLDAWNSFSLVDAGANLMAGLAQGITNGLDAVLSSVTSAGQAVIDRVKAVFGIHSPSKVFEELGGYTAQGFQVGLEGGQPGVQAAMQSTLAPSVPATSAAAGGAGGGGGASVSINLGDIVVNARTGADPREIAKAVQEAITSQLAIELERLAAGVGYSPAEATLWLRFLSGTKVTTRRRPGTSASWAVTTCPGSSR